MRVSVGAGRRDAPDVPARLVSDPEGIGLIACFFKNMISPANTVKLKIQEGMKNCIANMPTFNALKKENKTNNKNGLIRN